VRKSWQIRAEQNDCPNRCMSRARNGSGRPTLLVRGTFGWPRSPL